MAHAHMVWLLSNIVYQYPFVMELVVDMEQLAMASIEELLHTDLIV